MRKIAIKRLRLTNFKGARDLTVEFGQRTEVRGRNASGKTTIFDAFCYALFGKDSLGRSDFGIKTVDADGKPIWQLPHEVECTLDVDGRETVILRGLKEKWVKTKGEAVAKFQGHEEVRMIDGVPKSATEMKNAIAEICDEDTFRLITNPACFPGMKADAQRAILTKLVDVTYTDVAASTDREDFAQLLARLNGKPIEDFKKEVAAKKKRLKTAIDDIPPRIEENRSKIKDVQPWKEELAKAEANLADVEKQMDDEAARVRAAGDRTLSISKRINNAKRALEGAKFAAQENALASYRTAMAVYNEKVNACNEAKEDEQLLSAALQDEEKKLAQLRERRERLVAEWRDIKARTLTIDPDNFVCPTCGRKLDLDDIEAKTKEMHENFNAEKSSKLEANKQEGTGVKNDIANSEAKIGRLNNSLAVARLTIGELAEDAKPENKPSQPDTEQAVAGDPEVQRWQAEVEKWEAELAKAEAEKDNAAADNSAKQMLTLRKNELKVYVDTLKERRQQEKANGELQSRIDELETELRKLSDELAELEQQEITAEEFSRARSTEIERQVNSLFGLVAFRLFEQQINGGIKETCVATVNGVPYRDLNNAMRIHAGCDILRTIAERKGILAPVFIDNVETLNCPPTLDAQTILLRVTDDERLTVNVTDK